MHLGAQYYRPPFPRDHRWRDDLAAMREAGLDTIQLWVLWGWVEPAPGRFDFSDYDELVALADRVGLKVVLSTIAEIQPMWIHREIPHCHLINSDGQPAISDFRNECHFGLTPGGCTDHPQVWERMSGFLERTTRQYRGATNLLGWDCWNELRWNVGAGLACFCPHTLAAWRRWLDQRHGGLDGLNRRWLTRYTDWADVNPSRGINRPFTVNMAWMHFITERANAHAAARYAVMKGLDPHHPVTLHGGDPSPNYTGGASLYPLDRGNDWRFAEVLDGVGCSSFPRWFHFDDAEFGSRIEYVKAAAGHKQVWLSELQGGRSSEGFSPQEPVEALGQQRWIWNGLACGADTILFWCWRDEVFCREAGGFGITGTDGLAQERLAAMRRTGEALARHRALLEGYQPSPAQVGLWFSPQSYYHHWATEATGRLARHDLTGYARALVRCSIPYTIVEEEHLQVLDRLSLVILPRVSVLSVAAGQALEAFVRRGGLLLAESECGAFSPEGLHQYGPERFLAGLTGWHEIGRRILDGATADQPLPTQGHITITWEGRPLVLEVSQWLTPLVGDTPATVLGRHPHGALFAEIPVGAGRVFWCGTYLGNAYYARKHGNLEVLLAGLAGLAQAQGPVQILAPQSTAEAFLYLKHGTSAGRRLLFAFFGPGQTQARLRLAPGFVQQRSLLDLLDGETIPLTRHADGSAEVVLNAPAIGFRPLVEVQ